MRYHNAENHSKRNRSIYHPFHNNCENLARAITLDNIVDVDNYDLCCFYGYSSVQVRRINWMIFCVLAWALSCVIYLAILVFFEPLYVNALLLWNMFPAITMFVLEVMFMIIYHTSCCFYCMRGCKTEIPCCMCKRMNNYSFYCCRCWCCKGDIDLFRTKQDEYTIHHKHSIDGWCALFDAIFRDILFIVGFQLSSILFEINVCDLVYQKHYLCQICAALLAIVGGCVGYIIGGVVVFWINKCCFNRGCVEEVDESRPRSDGHETIHV